MNVINNPPINILILFSSIRQIDSFTLECKKAFIKSLQTITKGHNLCTRVQLHNYNTDEKLITK